MGADLDAGLAPFKPFEPDVKRFSCILGWLWFVDPCHRRELSGGGGAAMAPLRASKVPSPLDLVVRDNLGYGSSARGCAPVVLAFYLPQFHPIPENDQWWEPGFTEWTNVAAAKPLFPRHFQPHLPGELGFYDLRVPEVRHRQAALAQEYGCDGFAYWHYWFGGRRLLERPFGEALADRSFTQRFCLAWANESWTGVWHGAPGRVLMEQTYPGEVDNAAHFEAVLPAFSDPRYICVDGRPLFYIRRSELLKEPLGSSSSGGNWLQRRASQAFISWQR